MGRSLLAFILINVIYVALKVKLLTSSGAPSPPKRKKSTTKINVIITNRHCLLVCGCSPAAECRDPACGSSLRVNNHGHGYTHKQTHNQTHVKLLLWPQVNLYNHYGRWMVKCIHWISITVSHEHFDSHIRKPLTRFYRLVIAANVSIFAEFCFLHHIFINAVNLPNFVFSVFK